jgi:hypothetical protein
MNEEKQKSYIPAILAGLSALWLGAHNRGSLLTDIAHESIGKVLYGEKEKPKRENRNRKGSGKNGKPRRTV